MNENTLGKRMKSLREKDDLKQNHVANKLGVSPYQLSRYESGKTKPDPDMIASIASFYNVTTDYLLGRSDNPRMNAEQEFQDFANNPKLNHFFKDIEAGAEQEQEELRQIWEIIKKRRKSKEE
ncbi:helix-turn-helix domain-containing protein [Sporosarcina sp. OR05]|uniref:helix-turn-helix domain-containing protein n=1 Tax=Sporosarcina sp. OR05 TaxID=2969819 RepID=UPI00352A0536